MKKEYHVFVLVLQTILLYNCIGQMPHDEDFYYDTEDKSIGKIIAGTIRADNTFGMEPLIYPRVDKFQEFNNFIIAYQIPDISDFYYRNNKNDSGMKESDSETYYNDSINCWIREIRKLRDCYWIIRKSPIKVYGPLNEKEYWSLYKSLDVENSHSDKKIRVYWID